MNKIIKFPKNRKVEEQLTIQQLIDGNKANFTKFCFCVAFFTILTSLLLLFGLGIQ